MKENTKKIPDETRGRKPLTDWTAMQIGDSVIATSCSCHYWNKKLAPKHFVKRGSRIYRQS
jgi:hypothetical protein